MNITNNSKRLIHLWLGIVLLSQLYLVWGFDYFPSQDGPVHRGQSFIIYDLWTKPDSIYRNYFLLDFSRVSNTFTQLVMASLHFVSADPLPEKLFLSAYFVIFSFGIFRIFSAVRAINYSLLPLGAFIGCNFLLLLGSYNFSMGMAFALIAIAQWIDFQGAPSLGNGFKFCLLAAVCFFCHPLTSVFLVLVALVFLQKPFKAGWPLMVASLGPAFSLFDGRRLEAMDHGLLFRNFPQIMNDIFVGTPFSIFGGELEGMGVKLVSFSLIAILGVGLVNSWNQSRLKTGRITLLWSILAIGSFAAPWRLFAVGFFWDRTLILFWIGTVILASLLPVHKRMLQIGGLCIFVGMSQVTLSHFMHFSLINDYLAELESVLKDLPRSSTIVPVVYGLKGPVDEGLGIVSRRLHPFEHAVSGFTAKYQFLDWDNFTALSSSFPLRFKEKMKPGRLYFPPLVYPPQVNLSSHEKQTGQDIDYVVLWGWDRAISHWPSVANLEIDLGRSYQLKGVSSPRSMARLYKKTKNFIVRPPT